MNPFKYGITDSLLKRPANCIFASWHDAQEYLKGYLHGDDLKRQYGI